MNNYKAEIKTELCVIGGGMAGLITALSCARKGKKVVLVHDRPVLGGNASGEVRMWIRGAKKPQNREGGILQEIELENICVNPSMNFSVWDSVLYGKIIENENITLLLNCSCIAAQKENNSVKSIDCWQLTTYTRFTISADFFADCSGDSILAPIIGAKYTSGREDGSVYGEKLNVRASKATMGTSCLIQARETKEKVEFIPPHWAKKFTKADFERKNIKVTSIDQNFWWIETGAEDDTVKDAEKHRDELLKIALGVWDYIKNDDNDNADNWELDWIGFLPAKRESRRYIGDYVLTSNDLIDGTVFKDAVAYGGWSIDNHDPRGFYSTGVQDLHTSVKEPYEIPFRCMYSKNIDNLLFAGRNISCSHLALSSTRVMATCAIIGQAVGTAVSLCLDKKILPRDIYNTCIDELQYELVKDGCYLPNYKVTENFDFNYHTNLSNDDEQKLKNGYERMGETEDENRVFIEDGERLEILFDKPRISDFKLRIVLDPDYSRESISSLRIFKFFAMKSNTPLNQNKLNMPQYFAKEIEAYAINGSGQRTKIYIETFNRKNTLIFDVPKDTEKITVRFVKSYGSVKSGVYSVNIVIRV